MSKTKVQVIDQNEAVAEAEIVSAEQTAMTEESAEQKAAAQQKKVMRIGIVGDNAVAEAMYAAFDARGVERKVAKTLDEVDELIRWKPSVTYICNEIPFMKNDVLDDAEFINIINKLVRQCGTGICIRSTINVETVERLMAALSYDVVRTKVVYNPVMTDSTDVGKILTSDIEFFGGDEKSLTAHLNILKNVSNFAAREIETGTIFEIVYAKLALSGLKAVKQTFFNQLHDAILDVKGANPAIVRRLIQKSPELVDRSVMVPTFIRARTGEDVTYKQARAFGGEYLNKDVRMFVSMTDKLSLLDECINIKNLKD